MVVWVVMRVCDFGLDNRGYEYGCRDVDAVFDNPESANAYVEKQTNGNNEIPLWDGRIIDNYSVEPWEVRK